MYPSRSSLRIYLIGLAVTSFSIWFYFRVYTGNTVVTDDLSYSKKDMDEDLCRIYTDLGLGAEKQGDFFTAINEYKKALSYVPNASIAQQHLILCQNRVNGKRG